MSSAGKNQNSGSGGKNSPAQAVSPQRDSSSSSLPSTTNSYAPLHPSAVVPKIAGLNVLNNSQSPGPAPLQLDPSVVESDEDIELLVPDYSNTHTSWEYKLVGLKKVLPSSCKHSPLLRLLPDYEPHEILFLIEAEEYIRNSKATDLANRPPLPAEARKILRKYLDPPTAALPLRCVQTGTALHLVQTFRETLEKATEQNSSMGPPLQPILDFVARPLASAPLSFAYNAAQTRVVGALLLEEQYRLPETLFSSLVNELCNKADGWTSIATEQPQQTSPPSVPSIAVRMERKMYDGVVLVRGTGTIPFAAERVRSAICTPAARKFWEEAVFEVKVISKSGDDGEVLHVKQDRMFPSLKKRDYTLFTGRKLLPGGVFVSITSSVHLPGSTRSTEYIRGDVPLLLLCVKPIGGTNSDQCSLTFVSSVNYKGKFQYRHAGPWHQRYCAGIIPGLVRYIGEKKAASPRPESDSMLQKKARKFYVPFHAKVSQTHFSESAEFLNVVEGDSLLVLKVSDTSASALPGNETCQCYATGRVGLVKSSRLHFDERAEYPSKSESYSPLLNLLLEPSFYIVTGVGEALEHQTKDVAVKNIIRLFEKHGKLWPFIFTLMRRHIAITPSAGTLFRGSELASVVLSRYVRIIGLEYLSQTLGSMVEQAIASKAKPELLSASDVPKEVIDANLKPLQNLILNFLQKIFSSFTKIPRGIRLIANQLRIETAQKFPQSSVVIGGFFFLRFICPAIISPETFGIAKPEAITPEVRKILVFVSKGIQNISNVTEHKEPHMELMNEFIRKYIPPVKNFLEQLASSAGEFTSDLPTELLTDTEEEQTLASLHENISTRLAYIKERLDDLVKLYGPSADIDGDAFEKILEVLVQLGPPGPRQKKLSPQEQLIEQMVKQMKGFSVLQSELKEGIMQRLQAHVKDQDVLRDIQDKLSQLQQISVQVGMFKNILLTQTQEKEKQEQAAKNEKTLVSSNGAS